MRRGAKGIAADGGTSDAKRASITAGVVLTALAFAVAGCGTQESRSNVAQATELEALTDAEQFRITDAKHRLIKTCMAQQGFEFWEEERLSLDESRTLGYAHDDVDWAREHGYGSRIQRKIEKIREDNPNLAYRKNLSTERRTAYDIALDGGLDAPVISAEIPGGGTVHKRIGGCVAEVEEELYGDLETWFTAEKVDNGLRSLYVPQIMRDSAFTTALDNWSQCMDGKGYPYADPEAARAAAEEKAAEDPSDETFADERDMAVADATCTRDSSLRAIGEEREKHYLNQLRDEYGETLDTSRQIQHDAFARATKIVGPRV